MIELCDECDYTILIADLIATLLTMDKHKQPFTLKIWINGSELPFEFKSSDFFNFLQEGIRIETKDRIEYLFYDVITEMVVEK